MLERTVPPASVSVLSMPEQSGIFYARTGEKHEAKSDCFMFLRFIVLFCFRR